MTDLWWALLIMVGWWFLVILPLYWHLRQSATAKWLDERKGYAPFWRGYWMMVTLRYYRTERFIFSKNAHKPKER